MQAELEALAETVLLSSPWLSPEAGEPDRRTVDEWLRGRGVVGARVPTPGW